MRIATFNLENLDEGGNPPFEVRAPILRPQLQRLRANILCFQEIHGQDRPDQDRDVFALRELLKGTRYEGFHLRRTRTKSKDQAYRYRNLVTVSEFPVVEHESILGDLLANKLQYNLFTDETDTVRDIRWERPILYTRIQIAADMEVHVINVHLKSRNPTNIPVQKEDRYTWKTATGWAEGYFLSAMKRVGQAFEARVLIDTIFDADPQAKILICGDFNAHAGEVPIEVIAGRVENHNNPDLLYRVMFPCEESVPESRRYTHIHHGQGNLLDHMLVSRSVLEVYRGAEIHNEALHDESVSFAFDTKFPESDHAPFIAEFDLP